MPRPELNTHRKIKKIPPFSTPHSYLVFSLPPRRFLSLLWIYFVAKYGRYAGYSADAEVHPQPSSRQEADGRVSRASPATMDG